LLLLYNLIGIVDFPRHNHTSSSAIDNIFIDISHFHDYSLTPLSNDLSDHDAQILISKTLCQSQYDRTTTVRKVDQHTISDFIDKLSKESWDNTFNNTDVNHMFNSFLNTFLRIFYSCFPLARIKNKKNNTISWITLGIKKSCKRKRELFCLVRDSNNPALKWYYKSYSRILAKVIKEAKRLSYNSRILKLNNKVKTTWNIINDLLGKQRSTNSILKLSTEGSLLTNPNDIAGAFNKYFSSIINIRNRNNLENTRNNTTST